MEISPSEEGGVTLVALEGELDTGTAQDVQKQLAALIDQGRTRLLLDFEKLDFITSAGLRVLLATTKRLRGMGGDLRVCNLNEAVAEVFDISGFSSLLRVFGTRAEALAGF